MTFRHQQETMAWDGVRMGARGQPTLRPSIGLIVADMSGQLVDMRLSAHRFTVASSPARAR